MKAIFRLPENNIKASFSISGGGGGTLDYERLNNKPSINNVELIGNKTSAELGLASISDIPTLQDLVTPEQLGAINSGATSTNIAQITTNANNIILVSNSVTSLASTVQSNYTTLDTLITNEETARQNADNSLQSQIDAIVVSSDVFDIVGTYAELQAYNISIVPVNDIIKVLVDSTHNNSATYYRCVENSGVKSWSYIGSEGAYYTKSEADGRFVAQTITVNGQPLSSNVTLTASDVGALPDSTIIPTMTSQLINNSGYITGITLSDVETALGYVPYNSSNPNGYITSADLPTVNNPTITFTQGGVTKGTITLNQSSNQTIALDAGGIGGGTWGSITGTLSDQTDLQNALNAKLNTSDVTEYTAQEVETLWGSI